MRTHRPVVCVAALVLAFAISAPARAQQPSASQFRFNPIRAYGGQSTAANPPNGGSAAAKPAGPITGTGTMGQLAVFTDGFVIGDSGITSARGRLGIGTSNLTSPLTVEGVIESTSGGFKFPDGTSQNTAGLPIVWHNLTLSGRGTSDIPLSISAGGVGTAELGAGAVTASKIAAATGPDPGQVLGFSNGGLVWLTPAGSINAVVHDSTLTGNGNKAPLGIADGGVGRSQIADDAVNSAKIASGQVVKNLNGLSDGVTITGGANITITPAGNTLTIAASQNDGISRVIHDSTLTGDGTPGVPLALSVPLSLSGAVMDAGVVSAANTGSGYGLQGTGGVGVLGTSNGFDPGFIDEVTGAGVGGVGGSNGVVGVGGDFGVIGHATEPTDDGAGVLGGGGGGDGLHHAGVGVRGNGGSSGDGGGPDTSGGTGVLGVGGAHPVLGGDGVVGRGGNADPTGTTTGGNGVVGIGGDGAAGTANHGTAGIGIVGFSGVGSDSVNPDAGYFDGDVEVTGNVHTSGGSLKIDHPLDPENKYLSEATVASPDMKNIYDGVIALDGDGEATVELPGWVSALNRDFRYQLTSIGAPAPGLYVAAEVADNRFHIAGGAPGMKVSWQLTGIRQDGFANKHRVQVEEDKPESERGTYLHPEAFDQPATKGVEWVRHPEVMKMISKARDTSAPQ